MDGTGPERPLSDSQLDRDIESALSIEPSPEFIARARARIAAEPGPLRWRLVDVVSGGLNPTRRWAVQPLAVMAMVAVVLAIVVPQVMRNQPDGPVANASRPVEAGPSAVDADTADTQAGLNRQSAEGETVGRQMVRHVGRPFRRAYTDIAESAGTVPLRLSRAVFSERDRQAFDLFVVAAGEGRVPDAAANDAAGDSGRVVALAIEPLIIDPLPVLARVQQQGEGQW